MLLVHIGHCLGDPRAVRAQHRVDLVLRDELLVEAGRCLPIRCVIIDHELNPTPEHSAFLIRMLLAKKVTFTYVAPLYGGISGESRGCADADRLLRQACGRRPQAKAEAKADQPRNEDIWVVWGARIHGLLAPFKKGAAGSCPYRSSGCSRPGLRPHA